MRRIACCAPSVIESASSSTTTLCLPGGSVTFFWANALIRFRTTSIQSRCAVLRFSKLTDEQVLKRLQEVLQAEEAPHNDAGLEALIFSAEGDMRQALNNAQATHSGFGFISSDNVFQVCDQPQPLFVRRGRQ